MLNYLKLSWKSTTYVKSALIDQTEAEWFD